MAQIWADELERYRVNIAVERARSNYAHEWGRSYTIGLGNSEFKKLKRRVEKRTRYARRKTSIHAHKV